MLVPRASKKKSVSINWSLRCFKRLGCFEEGNDFFCSEFGVFGWWWLFGEFWLVFWGIILGLLVCLSWITTFYPGKSPWSHHLENIFVILYNHLKQINVIYWSCQEVRRGTDRWWHFVGTFRKVVLVRQETFRCVYICRCTDIHMILYTWQFCERDLLRVVKWHYQ